MHSASPVPRSNERFVTPAADSGAPGQPTPAWRDEDLVEECLRGNEQAWAAVVDKYSNLVYSAALKYRLPQEDAADVYQDVWVDLVSELKNLRKPGSLGGWLIAVATHKSYRLKRRRKRTPEQPSSPLDPEPVSCDPLFPEWKESLERSQILRDCIARMPDRCRRMVHLLFYQRPTLPYAEIARQFGLAEGSIGFIRGRCLERLRSSLERKGF